MSIQSSCCAFVVDDMSTALYVHLGNDCGRGIVFLISVDSGEWILEVLYLEGKFDDWLYDSGLNLPSQQTLQANIKKQVDEEGHTVKNFEVRYHNLFTFVNEILLLD